VGVPADVERWQAYRWNRRCRIVVRREMTLFLSGLRLGGCRVASASCCQAEVSPALHFRLNQYRRRRSDDRDNESTGKRKVRNEDMGNLRCPPYRTFPEQNRHPPRIAHRSLAHKPFFGLNCKRPANLCAISEGVMFGNSTARLSWWSWPRSNSSCKSGGRRHKGLVRKTPEWYDHRGKGCAVDYEKRLAISARMIEQLRVARAEYEAARAHFTEVVEDVPSGLPAPDGASRVAASWTRFATRPSQIHGCTEAILRFHDRRYHSKRRPDAKTDARPPRAGSKARLES